jgi:hypothetical protein
VFFQKLRPLAAVTTNGLLIFQTSTNSRLEARVRFKNAVVKSIDSIVSFLPERRQESSENSNERNKPMRTSPWYSTREGETRHHDNTKCTEGNNIESKYRKEGTGGLPLCHHCKTLDDKGE